MSLSRTICAVPLLLLVTACPPKDPESDDEPKKTAKATTEATTTPTPAPSPTPAPTSTVKIDTPPSNPAIEAKVKAELDNRSDGITGTAVTTTGAKATFQAPKDWTTAKSGDFNTSNSADKKAVLGAGAGGTEKIDAVASAAGLTACKWNPNEAVTWGKDKIAAQAADGLCTKDGAEVKAAVVTGENLVVVGGWAPGTDAANVFGAMRSAVKAGGTGGGIAACCAALKGNAKSAPPQQQGAYLLAAGACQSAMSNPNTAQALAAVRAAAVGIGLPAACK